MYPHTILFGMEQETESILWIKIDNSKPVELLDLTEALLGIADEYQQYVGGQKEFKLLVREIKTGSIETALIELAPLAPLFVEQAGKLVEFGKYIYKCIDWFRGNTEEKPNLVSNRTYGNIEKLVNPIAKDNASQMNFETVINGNVENHFYFGSLEANAIQNKIRKEIEQIKSPVNKYYEKVVLYWHQAKNDMNSPAGDRAIIEAISKSAKKVIFLTEDMKGSIIHQDTNPFLYLYVVDVEVETVKDNPVAYKILKIHEKFPKSEN